MLAFLSDEWIEALDAAARASTDLRESSNDLCLTIQHEIVEASDGNGDGDDRATTFHIELDHGAVAVRPGPASTADGAAPTILFRHDRATAAAVATGALSAQRAFMSGRMRVGGDLRVLIERRELLAGVGDIFAAVRADTEWPPIEDQHEAEDGPGA